MTRRWTVGNYWDFSAVGFGWRRLSHERRTRVWLAWSELVSVELANDGIHIEMRDRRLSTFRSLVGADGEQAASELTEAWAEWRERVGARA